MQRYATDCDPPPPTTTGRALSTGFRLRLLARLSLGLMLTVGLATGVLLLSLDRPYGSDYRGALAELGRIYGDLPLAVTATALVQVLLSLLLICLVCVTWSHKIAGPLYRLRHTFARVAAGNLAPMGSLRQGDQLQALPELFNAGLEQLSRRRRNLESELDALLLELDRLAREPRAEDAVQSLWRLEDRLRDLARQLEAPRG